MEERRKPKWVLRVMFLSLLGVFLCLSQANAGLIGVDLTGIYPDIQFDVTGSISYSGGTFTLTATDLQYAYAEKLAYSLFSGTGTVAMALTMNVDSSGRLISGTMTETVTSGYVTIGDNVYNSGQILLTGTVAAYGFLNYQLPPNPRFYTKFDYLVSIDSDLSRLVVDGLWASGTTGITVDADDAAYWDGKWDHDFSFSKLKGDKAAVPEPATLLLLGAGLLVVGCCRRIR